MEIYGQQVFQKNVLIMLEHFETYVNEAMFFFKTEREITVANPHKGHQHIVCRATPTSGDDWHLTQIQKAENCFIKTTLYYINTIFY